MSLAIYLKTFVMTIKTQALTNKNVKANVPNPEGLAQLQLVGNIALLLG